MNLRRERRILLCVVVLTTLLCTILGHTESDLQMAVPIHSLPVGDPHSVCHLLHLQLLPIEDVPDHTGYYSGPDQVRSHPAIEAALRESSGRNQNEGGGLCKRFTYALEYHSQSV